jgi:hypothetical protein
VFGHPKESKMLERLHGTMGHDRDGPYVSSSGTCYKIPKSEWDGCSGPPAERVTFVPSYKGNRKYATEIELDDGNQDVPELTLDPEDGGALSYVDPREDRYENMSRAEQEVSDVYGLDADYPKS